MCSLLTGSRFPGFHIPNCPGVLVSRSPGVKFFNPTGSKCPGLKGSMFIILHVSRAPCVQGVQVSRGVKQGRAAQLVVGLCTKGFLKGMERGWKGEGGKGCGGVDEGRWGRCAKKATAGALFCGAPWVFLSKILFNSVVCFKLENRVPPPQP